MIEFRNVSKIYPNGTEAITGFNLQIKDGEFVFVIGPSGAGKSTLIKLMMREEEPSEGEIFINGFDLNHIRMRDIPELRCSMGVMFQNFRLIPDLTVFENVALAMRIIGARNRVITSRVNYVLELMDIKDKAHNFPTELSGGEQQRCALARALVNNPPLIIADEPTGNVDPKMSSEIMDLLVKINELGTTVVVVTHDKKLVDRYKKRVVSIVSGNVSSDRKEATYDEEE